MEKRRYSIFGTEYGSAREVELAQVDNDPQPILDALAAKTLSVNHSAFPGGKKTKVRKFTWLRIVDNTK